MVDRRRTVTLRRSCRPSVARSSSGTHGKLLNNDPPLRLRAATASCHGCYTRLLWSCCGPAATAVRPVAQNAEADKNGRSHGDDAVREVTGRSSRSRLQTRSNLELVWSEHQTPGGCPPSPIVAVELLCTLKREAPARGLVQGEMRRPGRDRGRAETVRRRCCSWSTAPRHGDGEQPGWLRRCPDGGRNQAKEIGTNWSIRGATYWLGTGRDPCSAAPRGHRLRIGLAADLAERENWTSSC